MRSSLFSHLRTLAIYLLGVYLVLFLTLISARAEVGMVTGALAPEHQSAKGGIGGESLPQWVAVPILVFSVVAITVSRRHVRH